MKLHLQGQPSSLPLTQSDEASLTESALFTASNSQMKLHLQGQPSSLPLTQSDEASLTGSALFTVSIQMRHVLALDFTELLT